MDEIEDVQEPETGPVWDKPFYRFGNEIFVPCIYEGDLEKALLPEEFNAVRICLEGGLKSDLEWKQARIDALRYIEKGYMIMWEMDLGLFSRLSFPLSNQTQYLSLSLSLEHFRDSLWKEFGDKSLGLIVYRGESDFGRSFLSDEQQVDNLRDWLKDNFMDEKVLENETGIKTDSFRTIDANFLIKSEEGSRLLSLFCRNVAVEYLTLLTNRLPDTLPCYVYLDACALREDPLWQAQILDEEAFDPLNIIIRHATVPVSSIGTENKSSYGFIGSVYPQEAHREENQIPPETIGVCLPSPIPCLPSRYKNLKAALLSLIDLRLPFRLIPENRLISNWDGLDYIVYVPEGLSYQGKRKLQGFCAAGGTAVSLGELIGLSYEIPFNELMKRVR